MKMKKINFKVLSNNLTRGAQKGWSILTMNPYDSNLVPRFNIAISLEREKVSIAYLARFTSSFRVKKENTYTFDEDVYPSANNVLFALNSFIEQAGLSSQPVTLAVPKAWVVTRKWHLPRTIEDEIAMAITNEMDIITPFPAEEVYFDYQILSRDENNVYFVVAAVRRCKIESYLDLLSEKKFPVKSLNLNIAAFGTACTYLKKGNKNEFIVSKIDKREIEAAAVSGGRVPFLYSYTLKADEIEDAIQIEELLNSASSVLGIEESDIIVDLNLETSFLKYVLQDKFGSRIVPIDDLNTKALQLKQKKSGIFSAAGAAIEALKTDSNGLNLLLSGQKEKKKESLLLSMVLVVFLFVLFGFNMYQPVHKGRMEIQALDEKIDSFKKDVDRVNKIKEANKKVRKEIETINEFGENPFIPLDILKEITTLLPDDSWVTRLTIRQEYVDIEGYSDSATALIVKLEESKLFKNVAFSSPTIKDRRLNKDRYRIRAYIEGYKDKKKEGKR